MYSGDANCPTHTVCISTVVAAAANQQVLSSSSPGPPKLRQFAVRYNIPFRGRRPGGACEVGVLGVPHGAHLPCRFRGRPQLSMRRVSGKFCCRGFGVLLESFPLTSICCCCYCYAGRRCGGQSLGTRCTTAGWRQIGEIGLTQRERACARCIVLNRRRRGVPMHRVRGTLVGLDARGGGGGGEVRLWLMLRRDGPDRHGCRDEGRR